MVLLTSRKIFQPNLRKTSNTLFVPTRRKPWGGIYITSGIIDDKETKVVETVKAAGLEVLEVNHQGEWVSVVARKAKR